MSNAITDHERAKRTGRRKYHPVTEEKFGSPSYWDTVKKSLTSSGAMALLALLIVVAVYYTGKVFLSKNPRETVSSDVAAVTKEFKKHLTHIEDMVETISDQVANNTSAIEDLRSEPNPDIGIQPVPPPRVITKWRTKWRTKQVYVDKVVHSVNPVNARLQTENEFMRQKIKRYDLRSQIINKFYETDLRPGEKSKLVYTKPCTGI